jgi:transcriptional regulator with XRE-family HTH domain
MESVTTAARLRALRIRAGKSRLEVAQSIGLNPAWYNDLEQNEGELAATLTLFQAMQLASLLGVQIRDLFEAAPAATSPITLVDLPQRIRMHAAAMGIGIERLESVIGWSLQDFMDSPVQVTAELPIAFLIAVAGELGIDWLSLAPETSTRKTSGGLR